MPRKNNSNFSSRTNKGVSIIEFVAYMAILAIVLVSVIMFSINLIRNERVLTNKIRIINEADFAMRHIADAAFEAYGVLPDSGTSPNSVFNKTGAPCVNECVLAFDLSGDGAETVEFYVNSVGRLAMRRSGSVTYEKEINSPRISTLEFVVECVGDAVPCESAPKGVSVRLTIRDIANVDQTQTITTSFTTQTY